MNKKRVLHILCCLLFCFVSLNIFELLTVGWLKQVIDSFNRLIGNKNIDACSMCFNMSETVNEWRREWFWTQHKSALKKIFSSWPHFQSFASAICSGVWPNRTGHINSVILAPSHVSHTSLSTCCFPHEPHTPHSWWPATEITEPCFEGQ